MMVDEVVATLRSLGNPAAVAGMARYGIATTHALGVSMPQLRRMAKELGRNHALAQDLWRTGIHDAHILASLIDTPDAVTHEQMEAWVAGFDSWDVCDQCVMNLFARTSSAVSTAIRWSVRPEEYVKRAGSVVMARLASTDRTAADETFDPFLEAIERESTDTRNYVKKAINWALREIGARNPRLHQRSCQMAMRLMHSESASARWIGRDALKELEEKAAGGRLRLIGSL